MVHGAKIRMLKEQCAARDHRQLDYLALTPGDLELAHLATEGIPGQCGVEVDDVALGTMCDPA